MQPSMKTKLLVNGNNSLGVAVRDGYLPDGISPTVEAVIDLNGFELKSDLLGTLC